MHCNLSGSSDHGIFQARILEWVAISFSRGIFPTQGLNPGLLHCGKMLYHLSHKGSSILKAMTNSDSSILKSRDTLPTKVFIVKAMVFPKGMYGCESWNIKKAEH